MNTYSKFCPNVFLAKCEEQYKKGDIIEVTTKYGKINESVIFNLIYQKDGFYFYSIIHAHGFNIQERAKQKAEKYENWSNSAENKSNQYYEASQEGKDFLSLVEPIKIGHHSEKRHRALIERNWARMGKSIEFSDKAKEHENKAEYWAQRANDINLSMHESLDFFEFKLEEAKQYHADMKAGKIEKSHSFSLTYAKKEVNELQKKFDLAIRLWSDQ